MIGETNATQEIKFLKFVDYIESTGTQYIDTNVIPNNTTKVVFDMQMIDTTYSDEWQPLFGSRTSSSSNDRFIVWRAGSFQHLAQMYGSFPSSLTAISISENLLDRTVITLDRDKLYCDSTLVASSSELSFNGTYSMFLFTQNTGGAADNRKPLLKLYGCQIYNNDILIRDFKPCVDKNGIYCLYDLVERKFYYSKGTQNFIGDGWQPKTLEYIESTGTQYIDTGYYTNKNSEFVLDGYLTSSGLLFGSGTDGQFVSSCIMNHTNVYRARWRGNATSNVDMASTIPCDTTRHSFKVNRTSFYIDDVLIGNLNSTYDFTETRTTYIFGWNNGSGSNTLIPTNARIYSFKIYDNGTLVRDYIPAKDDSEVICLYDKVTKAYFYNAGTGSFVAG